MSILHMTQGLRLEHLVYGHIFPALVLLVVVANVFIVLVLSQKHMITPTNVVLKYMAIADLCVGLVPLPWNFFYHTLGNSAHDDRIQLWWCYMYKYSMDAVPPVCHNTAMWLTVLLAGQRYISIRYPLASRRLCSVRNVRFATIAITIASVLCGLPKSVDYYFEVYEGWAFMEPGDWVYMKTCLSGFTRFVKAFGSNTFFNAYFWTRVFGFILVPSLLLIVLNTLLIRGIRVAKLRKDRLLKEKRAREAQRQKDSNSTSIMLVVIVTIFLMVNLPQAVFMAMLCVQNTFGVSNSILEGDFPAAFLLVNNMLVMATYPINFGIYCFMSSSFRDTFRMFFCRKNWHRHFLARRGTMSCAGAGGPYNQYTVRRSDPSLQFSDVNCSGCVASSTRYSISDTMVVGNGMRATSATVTIMPFLPLLSNSSSLTNNESNNGYGSGTGLWSKNSIEKSAKVTVDIKREANLDYNSGTKSIGRQYSNTKTLESNISNNSTCTTVGSLPGDFETKKSINSRKITVETRPNASIMTANYTMKNTQKNEDTIIEMKSTNSNNINGTVNLMDSTVENGANAITKPQAIVKLDSKNTVIVKKESPANDSIKNEITVSQLQYAATAKIGAPLLSQFSAETNFWPYNYNSEFFGDYFSGRKIADIADTDEKIREADAVYL